MMKYFYLINRYESSLKKNINHYYVVILMFFISTITMAPRCSTVSSDSPNVSNTHQVHVTLSINWPASFPQAFNCTGTGPRLGNNPTSNLGSITQYQQSNLRFSEITIRDLVTNSIVDSKLWSSVIGQGTDARANFGNEVVLTAPNDHGYEVKFTQYDGCSSTCAQVQTSNGFRPIRLFWADTKSFGVQSGPQYIFLTPSYKNYIVCN